MSGKAVVGSIVTSVAIMSALMFFVMPMIFPVLQSGTMVVQTKYEEFNSQCYIFDNVLTWQKMPDTEMNISIQQNSRLSVAFDGMAILSLDSTFTVRSSYNVSLVIVGVTNRTIMVLYYDEAASTGDYRQLSYNLHLFLVTEPLNAGTYTITLYWISQFNAVGSNSLSLNHTDYNNTRSLFAQELKNI